MQLFTGNALWALIKQSDGMSVAVLLLLFGMSVMCWAIALYKYLVIRQKEKELREATQRLSAVISLEQLLAVGESIATTIPGHVITRSLGLAKTMLSDHPGLKKSLSERDMNVICAELDATVNTIMVHEECYMVVLKTSAEVAPLLGLFGTIWGLIHSFVRISQEQSADIITVAPGIAEALITTLVGLIVAIPALVLFNILQRRIVGVEHQLVMIADRCERVIQTTLQNRD